MSTATGISPYVDGDFVTEPESGRKIGFRGPIFHANYPAGLDITQETLDWTDFGYRKPLSWSYEPSKGFTLKILGDIPEWLQTRKEQHGVRFELRKPRGPVEYLKHDCCDN